MTELLTTSAKIEKSDHYSDEFKTSIMYALPAMQSGHNACPDAGVCAFACIDTTGRMPMVKAAREYRSSLFYDDRQAFGAKLIAETQDNIKRNDKKDLRTAERLNGTTDYAWEHIRFDYARLDDKIVNISLMGDLHKYRQTMPELFPDVQFYDYTKSVKRARQHANGLMPSNYHLTFSRSENTPDSLVTELVESGQNVAVVFDAIPETWLGMKVIDGDEHDLRFLDESGVIVGLKAKGPKAKKDTAGFVVRLVTKIVDGKIVAIDA
jgi:hypothetical protein